MDDEGGKPGPFLVTAADGETAVVEHVGDGQVHPLATNPGLEVGEVLEGTLRPVGPLGVTWRPTPDVDRWRPDIRAVDEAPGEDARTIGAEASPGQLASRPLEAGELHVLAVDPERTAEAVEEVVADETTRRVAARLGTGRVEVRGADGVIAVRYLD